MLTPASPPPLHLPQRAKQSPFFNRLSPPHSRLPGHSATERFKTRWARRHAPSHLILTADKRQRERRRPSLPSPGWEGEGGRTDSGGGRPGQSTSEPERDLPRFLKRTVEDRPKPVVLTAFSRAGAERGEGCARKDASVAPSPFVCLLPRVAAGVTSERGERSEGGGSSFFRRHTLSKTLSTT